jgi:hypothetical protein
VVYKWTLSRMECVFGVKHTYCDDFIVTDGSLDFALLLGLYTAVFAVNN